MTTVFSLASNTVRELVRNKLLYLLVMFSVLLILGSLLLAQLTIGQWERIMNDVGLATVQLAGALVAVLVGVGLIAGELDRRTIYVALSKPVTRAQFVIGKYVGLCLNLLLLVTVMGLVLAALLGITDYPMGATGFSALVLIYVELCLLAAFAVVFSSFTTQTLGVMFSVAIFVIGHLAGDLRVISDRLHGPVRLLVKGIAEVVPNLDLLNLKTQAANKIAVDAAFVASSAAYGLVYCAVAIGAAAYIFTRRDLK